MLHVVVRGPLFLMLTRIATTKDLAIAKRRAEKLRAHRARKKHDHAALDLLVRAEYLIDEGLVVLDKQLRYEETLKLYYRPKEIERMVFAPNPFFALLKRTK